MAANKKYRNTFIHICTVWFLLTTSNLTQAQNLESLSITKTYNNAPLSVILSELKTDYSLNLYYKDAWVKEIAVSISFNNIPVLKALDRLFENTQFIYITLENSIFVIPRENVALILKQMSNENGDHDLLKDYTLIGDLSKSGTYKNVKITGTVKDGKTDEVLPGTKIFIENTKYYAVTGYTGNYVLELPAGIYQLKAVCMGFENNLIDIKAVSPGVLNIEMFEESHAINEVVILGERTNNNVSRSQMSVLEMSSKDLKKLPSLVGEPDIIKSFATMPGVKSVSEFGSGINVRGGSEDQNLFLLENCPIYNTSHVMGLLSVINPDAVDKVALYKGHIPIEYGERVSSVMNIDTDNPTIDKTKVKGGIGIYSSRLMLETPIADKLIKLKIGARSSYSDYLLQQMPDYNLQNSSASFYDITGTAFINLKNNPITIFGYHSYDYFKYASNYLYDYGNRLGSVTWTHVFNPDLNVKTTIAYSKYAISNEDRQESLFTNISKSHIESKSSKTKLSYKALEANQIQLGAQAIQYSINPGNRIPTDNSQSELYTADLEQGNEISFFAGDEISFGPLFSISLGLRYTLFNYLGPKTVYSYTTDSPMLKENTEDSTAYSSGESIINYSGLEPRVAMKYVLTPYSSVKLSYNRNKQYLSLLSYTSISTPNDVWKLADAYMKPVIADQVALGYYQNFNENTIEASVEIYGKKLQNLAEYRNGAQLNFNRQIETAMLNASGTNYGIEFMVKKTNGKLTGNASYTYSRAFKQTNGKWFVDMINRNERYPSQYDIPHSFNINANYKLNRRIRFGATFSYATGRPVTLPEYTYNLGYSKLVYYSDRNKYRLPDYHRLDLSMSIDESLKKMKKWKGSWTFSLLNVYGRKNAYSIYYKKDTPTLDNNYQVFSLYKMYLIGVPTPTVTYNFIF